MSAVSRILQQPEYLHVAINHFPLIGLLVAIIAVIAGQVARSRPATCIGLALLALTSLSVWPVLESGEAGFDRVFSMADDPGQAWLKYHSDLAHRWVLLYYFTAGLTAVVLGVGWKWPKALLAGSIVAVLLAIASLTAGICIAQSGGEIRHREFRSGPAPPVAGDRGG